MQKSAKTFSLEASYLENRARRDVGGSLHRRQGRLTPLLSTPCLRRPFSDPGIYRFFSLPPFLFVLILYPFPTLLDCYFGGGQGWGRTLSLDFVRIPLTTPSPPARDLLREGAGPAGPGRPGVPGAVHPGARRLRGWSHARTPAPFPSDLQVPPQTLGPPLVV